MKKFFKIVIILLILGIIGASYGWFFIYNKPHTDYSKVEPFANLKAEDCYNEFANGTEESKKLLGQVIQISGEAKTFEKLDSLAILVFVFSEDDMFGSEGIRCSLSPSAIEEASNIALPANITVKGYCTGYNGSDLIIEQCILISN